MPTPKDAEYKLRQQEYRKLNSKRSNHKVPAGVKPSEYIAPVPVIKYK